MDADVALRDKLKVYAIASKTLTLIIVIFSPLTLSPSSFYRELKKNITAFTS